MKIKNAKLKIFAIIAALVAETALVSCKKAQNFSEHKLSNGLTVFTAENHAVPLVYIEIAVKAGGVTQTKENAGLFHLYEHMMFKGNSLYPDAASVQRALSDMGCTNWNGTTGLNCVNYFITVPSDQLETGLAFWNAAIRSPLMKEDELEKEKKVVLSEIQGGLAEPGTIFSNYLISNLFPDEPYRLSPSGSADVVKDASVLQLRALQNKYYIPKNAALFVGGDIDEKEALNLIEKIWGSWSNNGNEAPAAGKQQSMTPFANTKFAVMPSDRVSPQIAEIEINFRGADADFDREDSYALDYMLNLLDDPDGIFKKTVAENQELCIPDVQYISSGYGTSRADSLISFSATVLEPEKDLPGRAKIFMDQILEKAIPAFLNDEELFTNVTKLKVEKSLENNDIWAAQTATGLLQQIRFWWTVTDSDYYKSYNKKVGNTKKQDVESVIQKYIIGKNPIVTILVNPEIYEKAKDEFAAAGFETVTAQNAFWWNNPKYAPDAALIAKEEKDAEENFKQDTQIYKPTSAGNADYSIQDELEVKQFTLKNGIPVYFKKQDSSQINSVTIAVRGGIARLTPETSGLEDSLFTMMASSSKKYDYAAHNTLEFETDSSIHSSSTRLGSMITLTAIDEHLFEALPYLTDGFLHPSYEDLVYQNLTTSLRQKIQSMLNSPESILGYEASKVFYKGHPYETKVGVRPESFENITVANMKKLHKEIMAPENIFVVAVGNANSGKLVSELNKTLGQLKATGGKVYKIPQIAPVTIKGEPVILTHPSAAGTGYVSRFFATPSITSPDYPAALLAASMYSTVMFNVVREHHGVCYTPGSYCGSGFAPIGEEYLFKLSNPESFVSAMEEARNYMLKGQLIESLDDDGNYIFSKISDRLQSYKNKYINSTYGSSATTGNIASTIVTNLLTYDDIFHDRKTDAEVMAVSEEDVMKAFKKYWVDEPSQWWLMVGPDMKDRIKF